MHFQEITEHYVQKASLSKSLMLSPSFQSGLARRRAARRKKVNAKIEWTNFVRAIVTFGLAKTVVS